MERRVDIDCCVLWCFVWTLVERDKNTDLKSREGVIQSFSHHHSFLNKTYYSLSIYISAHEKKRRREEDNDNNNYKE